jgi:hypothetical protein
MTNAEDKKYIALHDKAEAAQKRWRCIRDETWGDFSPRALKREDAAWSKAKDAQCALVAFEEAMCKKYEVAA